MIHVHVDVDDLWIYTTEYRLAAIADSVYVSALPRFLSLFEEVGALATFFVVGRDLERKPAQEFCRAAIERGHEIANHTFSHPVSFHALDAADKRDEILRGDNAICEATGREPAGFRSPGYYLDRTIIDTLAESGYLYDSSILPTSLGPLFKLYLRRKSGRSLDKQFGIGRAPLAAQSVRRLVASEGPASWIYELPISVLPVLRLPVHSTFGFLYPRLLRAAVYRDLGRRRDGVLLFHAIDAIDDAAGDAFRGSVLPMRLPLVRRIELIREALAAVGKTMTTRDRLASLDPSAIPASRLLALR